MKYSNVNQRGIGMIEILVSLVILAVGLLSVATLHVNIINQSHESKARSEAVAIAESRIETMRNFGSEMKDIDDFDSALAALARTDSPITEITGTNAKFKRTEAITDNNSIKNIDIYVQWADKSGVTQEVLVSSSIVWAKPRAAGDVEDALSDPIIPSATGRARLGDGTLPSNATTTDTGDGMRIYDSTDGDLRLVDKDDTIVLTLIDACDITGGNCTDFVEISGRVYIVSGASMSAGNIYVKASDAAYCQLYYMDSGGDSHDVVNSTDVESAGSDYNYFRYTCYLGGGWHGNIGMVFGGLSKGGSNKIDKICVGDPNYQNQYEKPVEASRRVYRGMLYKHDSSGDPILTTIVDEKGNTTTTIIYSSIGVKDALELPHPGKTGHDFVIGANPTGQSTDVCQTMMTKPSSNNGAIFADMPTDFYCLNDVPDVDDFVSSIYTLPSSCPYDPSQGPATKHIVSGKVIVNSTEVIDTAMIDTINAMNLSTSDSAYNCTNTKITAVSGAKQYTFDYVCDVYDWGSGWTGYTQLNYESSVMACDYRTAYTEVKEDINASNNVCTIATSGDGGSGSILTVSGSVPTGSNKGIIKVTTTDDGVGAHCEVSSDKLNYACYSSLLADDALWTGTLTFTIENGAKFCIDTTGLVTEKFEHPDGIDTPTIKLKGIDSGLLSLDLVIGAGNGGKCL